MRDQGQSGQTIKMIKLFQAPRKISFNFHFETSISSLMMQKKLAELSNKSCE